MKSASKPLGVVLLVCLGGLAMASAGCHTYYNCPIIQGMAGWSIPSPLPPAGDTYTVVGYEPGIRFYVVKYDDGLYRGGDIMSKEGFESLKKLGIKTIIATNPQPEEKAMAGEFGMKYVEIPFGPFDLTKEKLDAFMAAVAAGPAPVYVKSLGGDRDAAILAAHYRIHHDGWTADKAIDEFLRLQGNFWDSLNMFQVIRDNASAPPHPATNARKES
jgi:protein tyrosine phosphatase (PTP) superfamily phosphohydrolase (DUF442 family)